MRARNASAAESADDHPADDGPDDDEDLEELATSG